MVEEKKGVVATIDLHGDYLVHPKGSILDPSFYSLEPVSPNARRELRSLRRLGFKERGFNQFLKKAVGLDSSGPITTTQRSQYEAGLYSGEIVLDPEISQNWQKGAHSFLDEFPQFKDFFEAYYDWAYNDFRLNDEEAKDTEELSQFADIWVVSGTSFIFWEQVLEKIESIRPFIKGVALRPFGWGNRQYFKEAVHEALGSFYDVYAQTDDVREAHGILPSCRGVFVNLDEKDAWAQSHLGQFGLVGFENRNLEYGPGATRRMIERIKKDRTL